MSSKKCQSAAPRCKNMMYVQQMAHLPTQTVADLTAAITTKLHPERYAVILHDKDVDGKGQPVASHVHAMMCFDNARSVKSVSKQLGDTPQQIERWTGNANNGFAYLVHETKGAKSQVQYDPATVTANFDFPQLLKQIGAEVAEAKASHGRARIDKLLNSLLVGGITKDELEAQLSGAEFAKCARQIETVYAKRLKNEAKAFRAKMVAENRQLQTIWIYGTAGTGKTRLAKKLAANHKQDFFVTGSSRDAFQNYNGQHTIIWDEFRPNVTAYQDFLRITDPYAYETEVTAPARYVDKSIVCDLIIITTPYSPWVYYREQFGDCPPSYRVTDSYGQLQRRLSLVIEMTENHINLMEYDPLKASYDFDPANSKPNPYSRFKSITPAPSPVDLFGSLFT